MKRRNKTQPISVRTTLVVAILLASSTAVSAALAFDPGSGGGGSGGHGGGSGSSGSGSSGSGSSGSGSWGSDSGSSRSGSWASDWGSLGSGSGDSGSGSSGSGSWGSGSSGGYSGSGDTLGDYETSKSGSGSTGSDSGSWDGGSGDKGSGSSDGGSGSDDGTSNSGHGSSDNGTSNSGHGSSDDGLSNGGHSSSSRGRDDGQSGDYWRELAARERPEFDRAGFPVRRAEVLAADLDSEQVAEAERQGLKLIDRKALKGLNITLFRFRAPIGMSASAAAEMLNGEKPGGAFELDHYLGVTSGHVDATKGSEMSDMKHPAKGRLWIGIIDTAVWTHATLRQTRVDARDFANSTGKPPFAHGTAVASILARQGAVRLTAANIYSADRRPYSSAVALVRALNWMVERKVPVINISIAGPKNALVDKAIGSARSHGHLVVAAAGNEGPAAPAAYPAASPGALAVTAIDRDGRVYPNANRGSHIEIAALGVAVGAEAPDGSLKPHSGTSFAAPFVSAALARCLERPDPTLSYACVRMMETKARDLGEPGRDPVYGYGLLVP